jgi:4-amino-4-deoxy-L-arabinose transferase-like glycosyltransferase
MSRKNGLASSSAFLLLLIIYLAAGALYAIFTPLWQIPDEPAHFNYVKYIAEERRLPELRAGDYPAGYIEEIKSQKFPSDMSIAPLRYEFYQPPLYYSLGALVYLAVGAQPLSVQVIALRLFSALLGAITLWLAYRIGRLLFPQEETIALGAAAFLVAVPMHIAMTAAVNSDALAELLLTATLYATLRLARGQITTARLLSTGALIGLAIITKATAYVSAPLALLGLWIGWTAHCQSLGDFGSVLSGSPTQKQIRSLNPLIALLLLVAPALLLSGGWLVRNAFTYGWLDPLGWTRHTQVITGQLTTAQYAAEHGWGSWLGDFLRTSFHSFWGQFGWMAVPMDGRIYLALGLLCALAALGLVGFFWRQRRERALSLEQWQGLGLAALTVAALAAIYLWYNRQLVQFQGRYLFAAMPALGLFFSLGLHEIARRGYEKWLGALCGGGALLWLVKGIAASDINKWGVGLLALAALGMAAKRALPESYGKWSVALIYAGLIALTLAAPFLFIVPYLR